VLALAMAGPGSVAGADTRELRTDQAVELTVWHRHYRGRIGRKPVHVQSLQRIGERIEGFYCYGVCHAESGGLRLSGHRHKNGLVLDESLPGLSPASEPTGHWLLRPHGDGWRGEWRSPGGKQRHPVTLEAEAVVDRSRELRVLAAFVPAADDGTCDGQSPRLSAIRVYRHGKLLQTLGTDSQGTCGMFLPQWVDMNFDGHEDLTIALMLPAGPNIPHQSWLFDAKAQMFVDAPSTLQELTSPGFDSRHRIVFHHWRGSCCSHGVATFRWNGGELEAVDSGESLQVPIWRGGKLGYMYSVPRYVDGSIEYSPRIVRDHAGELRLDGVDAKQLELLDEPYAWGQGVALEVFALDRSGGTRPVVSEAMRWVLVDDDKGKRWCPDVAAYDSDRRLVARHIVDAPESCSDTDPMN
jgi:hypothetical protein